MSITKYLSYKNYLREASKRLLVNDKISLSTAKKYYHFRIIELLEMLGKE